MDVWALLIRKWFEASMHFFFIKPRKKLRHFAKADASHLFAELRVLVTRSVGSPFGLVMRRNNHPFSWVIRLQHRWSRSFVAIIYWGTRFRNFNSIFQTVVTLGIPTTDRSRPFLLIAGLTLEGHRNDIYFKPYFSSRDNSMDYYIIQNEAYI